MSFFYIRVDESALYSKDEEAKKLSFISSSTHVCSKKFSILFVRTAKGLWERDEGSTCFEKTWYVLSKKKCWHIFVITSKWWMLDSWISNFEVENNINNFYVCLKVWCFNLCCKMEALKHVLFLFAINSNVFFFLCH